MREIIELGPYSLIEGGDSPSADYDRALAEPTFDYFDADTTWLRHPKAVIGTYVAENGFPVPLITNAEHWRSAIDTETAMIRSEAENEYSGYRGMFGSKVITKNEFTYDGRPKVDTYQELSNLAIRGLRNGEISAVEYMSYHSERYQTWPEDLARNLMDAQRYNVKLGLDMPDASLWEYIPGANVSIFGDPHVEGRYHIGFKPPYIDGCGGYSTGGFQVEPDQHTTPLRFRKHDVDFIAQPFIEAYEKIAALPLFDVEQRPVMELQLANDGVLHFLQYYKTGHRKDYRPESSLPFTPATDIKIKSVRGVTEPDGKNMRLFSSPTMMAEGIMDEAVYCSISRPGRFEEQLVAKMASFVLHRAYFSFQDNHFNSAPLFMPPLVAALSWFPEDNDIDTVNHVVKTLEAASRQSSDDRSEVQYFDIKATSNGHEVVLRSDWQPKTISYKELRRT